MRGNRRRYMSELFFDLNKTKKQITNMIKIDFIFYLK
jgi:hypothetical protein